MGDIIRDIVAPPRPANALDVPFKPSKMEWDFLKTIVSEDEEYVEKRVYEAQKQ